MRKVVFVGISNKEGKEPFDSSTKSGRIIDTIIQKLDCSSVKINYISYVPKNSEGKIRYPTKKELQEAYFPFVCKINELKPDLVVVCGNLVMEELNKQHFSLCQVLKIYHPSYVWVYKRKEVDHYILNALTQIKKLIF